MEEDWGRIWKGRTGAGSGRGGLGQGSDTQGGGGLEQRHESHGITSVQLYTVSPELSPARMDTALLRH